MGKSNVAVPNTSIKEMRIASGMTQIAFAEYLNIPRRTIQEWESDRRTPPPYVVELINYKLINEGLIKPES